MFPDSDESGNNTLPPIPLEESLTPPGVKQDSTSAKFIDDLTMATMIKLKDNLEKSEDLERPLVFHSKTQYILPDDKNPMIPQIKNLSEFAEENQMKVNQNKTKIMLFNRGRSYDFQPTIYLNDSLLEVVDDSKLLGIMISSDLKWNRHVNYIRGKCLSKMWTIRRMKEIGGSIEDMLDVFRLQIRCLPEKGCPVYNGSLTQKDIKGLEGIQKTALKLILGYNYKGYDNALSQLKLDRLDVRRDQICKKFARKIEKSEKFSSWLLKTQRNTRNNKRYNLPNTRTEAYRRSPLFYLASLLNN